MTISIHALLAESDLAYPDMIICTNVISIHALLAESDGKSNKLAGLKLVFLSTLSLRRATFLLRKITITVDISIHALLAESDSRTKTIFAEVSNFYPRSPCGERLHTCQYFF